MIPNKILVTNINKLKNIQKKENSDKDIKGKVLEKHEENCHLRNHNEDLKEQHKMSKYDESRKKKRLRKFRMIISCQKIDYKKYRMRHQNIQE